MKIKSHSSINCLVPAPLALQPQSNIGALMLRWEGTADTGQTPTIADIPDIKVIRNQPGRETRVIYEGSAAVLKSMNDAMFGKPQDTHATAGATEVQLMLPFFVPGDPNALDIVEVGEMVVQIANAASGTIFKALTLEVFGVPLDAPEIYQPYFVVEDISLLGSGSQKYHNIHRPNTTHLFIGSASSADPTHLEIVRKNGLYVCERTSFKMLKNLAPLAFRIESTTLSYFPLELNPGKDKNVDLSTGLTINIYGGTGTLRIISRHVEFSGAVTESSIVRLNAQKTNIASVNIQNAVSLPTTIQKINQAAL